MRPTTALRRLAGTLVLLLLVLALVGGLYWALNPERPPEVARVAGETRYATAAAVAIASRPDGVDTVYVATGADFPDALAAGPLVADDAALLLVDAEALPSAAADALDALEPDTVVLLGGAAVIADDVADAISGRVDAEVRRVAGADRFETAAELALAFEPGVPAAYIAHGGAFADALAGGAAAAAAGGPVLLVETEALPQPTADALQRLQPEAIVVLGGTAAVSETVEAELAQFAAGSVRRVRGDDRYETAVAVSLDAFERADVVHLAGGEDFADGLAGVAGASAAGGPLLLAEAECVPEVVLDEIDRLGADEVVLLGGEAVLAEPVADLLACGRAPLL
jgi:putative cell wall-binding protein